jgi:hypothetical protein
MIITIISNVSQISSIIESYLPEQADHKRSANISMAIIGIFKYARDIKFSIVLFDIKNPIAVEIINRTADMDSNMK